MNCDRIARVYRWCEYMAFGRKLESYRFRFLPDLHHCRSALLLGDGDGRFGANLASQNPALEVRSIELSQRMLAQARKLLEKSLGSVPASFLLEHADVRKADFPDLCFDLVATHFFLDCFEIPEIESLIRRVTQACQPGALWVISEFAQPVRGWKAVHATLWLGVMYRWFQLTTGLKTKKLPDFQPALCDHGWKKVQEAESPTGLIRSEMWSLEHNRAST